MHENDIEVSGVPITLAPGAAVDGYAVTKSNRLIEGQANLTARQQKLLAACISLVNPKGDYPNGIRIELDDDQIEELTHIPKRSIPEFIEDAARALHSIPIKTPGSKPGETDYINIALRSKYDRDERIFRITFHPGMEEELLNLDIYTRYALASFVSLHSKYATRFFELLSKVYNQKRGGQQYWKAKLRDVYYPLGIMDIDGTPIVKTYANNVALFRQQILTPIIKEINENTSFEVEAKPYKAGRRIAGFIFHVRFRPPLEIEVVDEETGDFSGLELRLHKAGIKPPVRKRWLANYSQVVIADNLDYMLAAQSSGIDVRNPSAFLQSLLQNNVAHLPEVANPYAQKYRSTPIMRAFVKNVVMPIWWSLSPKLQKELQDNGSFSLHPVTKDDYRLFESESKETSVDEAVMLLDLNLLIEEWNEATEGTMSTGQLFE